MIATCTRRSRSTGWRDEAEGRAEPRNALVLCAVILPWPAIRPVGTVVGMPTTRSSIAVILSAGGAQLDLTTIADMPCCRVVRAEVATSARAACVTATVEHDCETRELLRLLRPWAGGRGWAVTVAPLTVAS